MLKTFFVLWIWFGAGQTQTLAMDHFATKDECEAAKQAIVDHYKDTWLDGNVLNRNLVCLEANIKRN